MSFSHAGGMSSMLKEGAKQMSGLEEAVIKNVSCVACLFSRRLAPPAFRIRPIILAR